MSNTDAAGSPPPPPHLRVSENEERECDTCTHYLKGGCAAPFTGRCHMYNDLPLSGEWVCDSWKKGRNQDPDEADEREEYGPPKTLKEAARRTRREFARVRGEKPRD